MLRQSQLKNWPIFNFVDKKFTDSIKIVMVYGDSASDALMVLEDDSVYMIDITGDNCLTSGNRFRTVFVPTKLDDLSNKGVKDFAWGTNTPILALTEKGEVYSCSLSGFLYHDLHFMLLDYECFKGKVITQIVCGHAHCLALTKEGQVLGWGQNYSWQLEKVQYNYVSSTTLVNGTLKDLIVLYMACSDICSTVVTNRGEVYEWGVADFENADEEHVYQGHKIVGSLLGILITKVACGRFRTLALSLEGDLYAWDKNSYGKFGIVDACNYVTQINMKMEEKVADIAAVRTSDLSAAITRSGLVFIWGHCRGQSIPSPALTPFCDLHEAFAIYATPNVMHSPLTLGPSREEDDKSLIGCLRQAFDDPSTSDLKIKVDGKFIHVHKCMLKIRSEYFQAMFKEHWKESSQSIIEHNDFSYEAYKAFLKYLYTEEVDEPEENLLELLSLASAYSESKLKDFCMEKLIDGVSMSNVWQLYDIAVAKEYLMLEEVCFQFAVNHIALAVQSPHFTQLSGERIKTFMTQAVVNGAFKI